MAVLGARRIARPALARRISDGFDAGSVLLVAGPGYGKTMAIEEALDYSGRRSVWLACGQAGGEAGRLMIDAVAGLRAAVPGLADVVGDKLAAALEPVDVRSSTAVLLAELEHLLVEPLVIVFDDAEELAGADAALMLVDQLLNLRGAPLSLAIATRQPLPLRLAKLRAAARLIELGPAELSLTASECEELLRIRHGRAVAEDEVEAVVEASQGWPMGVALSGLAGGDAARVPREDLFGYLAEEVLDRLDPRVRLNVVDSSVPDALSPELVAGLGLPPDFLETTERSGLFLRMHPSGARSYHPLFRDFLRERLAELRSEPERAALHARVAECLAASGDHAGAIGHWFAAGRPREALGALSTDGAGLIRTSPGSVAGWLAAVPPALHGEPDHRFVEAQLLWATGQHERTLEPLRAAAAGYHAAGNQEREWLARVLLADNLFFAGAYEEISAAAEGWEDVDGPVAVAAMGVAWYEVVALATLGRTDEANAHRERLRRDPQAAGPFSFFDVLVRSAWAQSAGDTDTALELLHAEIAKVEQHDPFGRLAYALGMVLIMLRGRGDREAALAWVERCERESERAGMGFALRDFRLHRASLLAQQGDLARAEVEFARAGRLQGMGWRGVYEAEAEAHVASLRGDGSAAPAAQRALELAARAPLPWRMVFTAELAAVLADAGAPDAARGVIDATLAALDEGFPGDAGRGHRARLLASRACLEDKRGEADTACGTLRAAWEDAGGEAADMVRVHWPAVRPVLWRALAEGTITADDVIPAMQDALPGGAALVALIDHPDPDVRRAALSAALAVGHPEVLARLEALTDDADERVAAAAVAARERLHDRPPPLRFDLLGGFRVRRSGWELDEASWQRPMAARIARFLLVQGGTAVPEDALFEAFWADRPADAARQHLAVAVSRARKVLDLPGAQQSVIDVRERTYRLQLRERDSIDAVEFEAAAAAALADGGVVLLERAAAQWTGEPLPEDRYAEWTFAWRERLVAAYIQVLAALVDHYGRSGEQHGAVQAARRLLDVDPANEHAHRQLMVAYSRTGRTSHALRQYLECRRALVEEHGIEPSVETSRLQARILAGEPV